MKSSSVRRTGLLLCVCTALATAAQGAFNGRDIRRAPDMCNLDTVDTVTWYAGESVRLEIEPWRCGERVELPAGATGAWIVADEGGTNWLVRYDLAPAGGRLAFAFGAGEGNLPDGHDYTAYVSLLDGTNVLGVVDRFEVRVLGMAEDSGAAAVMPPDEYPAIVDAVHEYLLRTTDLAISNAAAVAELRTATNALAAGITTNAADILALQGGADALSTRATALEGATNSWNAAADAIAPLRAATNALSGRADAADSAIAALRAATNALSTAAAVDADSILALQASTNALDSHSARLEAATNFLAAGVASNAAAAASLRSATNALAGRVAANESAVAVLRNATNSLHTVAVGHSTAISALQTATNALVARAGRLETATNSLAAGVATNASAVVALRVATNALNSRAAQLESSTNVLAGRVGTNETAIASLQTATNALAGRVAGLETATNSLAARIGGEEANVAALQSATNALHTRTGHLEAATNALAARAGMNESAIDTLRNDIAGHQILLQLVDSEIGATQAATNALSGRVGTNETAIAGIREDHAALTGRVASVEGSIAAIRDATNAFATAEGVAANLAALQSATNHLRSRINNNATAIGNLQGTDTALRASTNALDASVAALRAATGHIARTYAAVDWAAETFVPKSVPGTNGVTGRGFDFLHHGGIYASPQRIFFQNAWLLLNGRGITNWSDIVAGYATTDQASAYAAAAAEAAVGGLSPGLEALRLAATNAAEDIEILFGHQQTNAAAFSNLRDADTALAGGIASNTAALQSATNHLRSLIAAIPTNATVTSNDIPSLDGYATKTWTAAYVATNTPSMDGYATEDYVSDWVGGLSNLVAAIAGTDGAGGTVDLSGFTQTLAALGAATNDLAGRIASNADAIANRVAKTGDTMTGTLAVPSLRAGHQVYSQAAGGIAAGSYASATSPWSFVWSGNDDINTAAHAEVDYQAQEGAAFGLDGVVPRTPTLGGFFGTDSVTWAPLDTVTFVGWNAVSGNPETYRFEDGQWIDSVEGNDWTDEEQAKMFLCPMEFRTKPEYDEETVYDWNADMCPIARYGSHGEGTFNINPVGGLSGFYVGGTNLDSTLSWRETLFGISLIPKYVGQDGDTMSGPLEIRMRNANWGSNASPLLVIGNTNRTGSHATVGVRNLRFEITTNNNLLLGREKSSVWEEGVMVDDGVTNSFGAGRFANVQHSDAFVWSARESPETRQGDGMGWPGTGPYGMTMGPGTVAFWPASPSRPEDQFYIGRNNLRQTISNNAVTAIFFKDYITGNYFEDGFNGRLGLDVGDGLRIKDFETNNMHVLKISLQSWLVGALQGLGIDIDDEEGDDPGSGMPHTRWVAGSNVTFRADTNALTDTYIDSDPGVATLNGLKGAVTILDHWGTPLVTSSDSNAILLDDPLPTEVRDFFSADLLVPVYEVESNAIRIVDFALGDFGTANACITFVGNPTNGTVRLESRPDATNDWTTWNNCWFSTAYHDTYGLDACYIVDATAGTHYRLVAEGGIPDRTNAALLASAPIYLGEAFLPGNRLATMDDVERAVAASSGSSRAGTVARRAWKDAMDVSPTNLAWNLDQYGTPYFANLAVGGWTNTIVSGGETNETIQPGTLSLNNQEIHSWSEIAAYADGVEFVQAVGVDSLNGATGAVTIAAGSGITIDQSGATITLHAGGGGAWTPSSRIVTATNATVLASDYLIWMDSEAAEDEQTILLPDMATDSQSIVIRHLGSDHPTTIVRATPTATNTYQLTGDGASIAVDWLGAKNTWYWRQAY